jgi:hypothetical protein
MRRWNGDVTKPVSTPLFVPQYYKLLEKGEPFKGGRGQLLLLFRYLYKLSLGTYLCTAVTYRVPLVTAASYSFSLVTAA